MWVYNLQGIILLCRGMINLPWFTGFGWLAAVIRDDFCSSPGRDLSGNRLWFSFGFVVDCLCDYLLKFFAMQWCSFTLWTSHGLWLALGKTIRPVLWPSLDSSFFGETLERERGTPQTSRSHGFLEQFNGMGFLRISFVYGEVKVISTAVVLDGGFSRPLTF